MIRTPTGANTWIEAGGSSATALVEASILGSHTLAPVQTLALGNLYNEALNEEDIDLEIRRAGGAFVPNVRPDRDVHRHAAGQWA